MNTDEEQEKIKSLKHSLVNVEVQVNTMFKDSPLLGLFRQSICSASGLISLMLRLKSTVGEDITKSKWQSIQSKLDNYEKSKESMKEKDTYIKMLEDRLKNIQEIVGI